MSPRLLSFLSDLERALQMDDPSPRGGAWENTRTVNYGQGLARLMLSTRNELEMLQPLGSILLQSFQLADGTVCLKIFLNWNGSESQAAHAIYAREDVNWTSEARQLASAWLNGPAKGAIAETAADLRAAETVKVG
jgi:hypothetical protein